MNALLNMWTLSPVIVLSVFRALAHYRPAPAAGPHHPMLVGWRRRAPRALGRSSRPSMPIRLGFRSTSESADTRRTRRVDPLLYRFDLTPPRAALAPQMKAARA